MILKCFMIVQFSSLHQIFVMTMPKDKKNITNSIKIKKGDKLQIKKYIYLIMFASIMLFDTPFLFLNKINDR